MKQILKTIILFLFKILNNDIKTKLSILLNNSMLPFDSRNDQTNHLEPENGEKKYRIVLNNYETNYDFPSGNWKNPGTGELETASVELEVARMWYAFTKLLRPINILETGVHIGYSTCYVAAAIDEINNNGHIYCIDPLIVPHLWDKTKLEQYITWFPKYSQKTLEDVKNIKFDLLILDSWHDYKTVMWELIHFEPLLKENGHILMHDTLFYDGVGAAVKQLYENPRFEVITVDSPRSREDELRCPGISVVRKTKHGSPLVFEDRYKDWYIGDALQPAFLRNYSEGIF